MPALAMAAAAWSCVEKILQLLQVTSAPSSLRVSISTAVWMVMCRQPATRAPVRGLVWPYFLRRAIRPGISFSASMISLRPQSARERSFTLYAWRVATCDTEDSLGDKCGGRKACARNEMRGRPWPGAKFMHHGMIGIRGANWQG